MVYGVLGGALLLAAVMLAGFAAVLSLFAGVREQATLAAVGRRAMYGVTALLLVATGVLLAAFLAHDFALAYVAQHTDVDTPATLAASAFYSGQEGSLLYWTLITAVLGSAAIAAAARLDTRASAFAAAVLGALVGFLLYILAFVADPFDLLATPARDGLGLNPLLRDGGMLVHPPFLLAGLSSFSVPFALTVGGLLAGRLEGPLLHVIRRFALLSWGLLSVGLTLGMWWAYHVLGWGGYWGWDPVENAALMPWLVATAYLHSVQVQERRGRLRAWSTVLVLGGFNLALLGTFIVRSGVVPSVHSFAVSPAGPWFFALLAASLLISLAVAVAVARIGVLRSDGPIEEPVSREGAFVLNNALLLAVVAVILWGSLLPLTAGLFTGSQAAAGPAFYDHAAGPLLLGVLVLLAVGPLVPWRGGGRAWIRALRPVGIAALLASVLVLVLGPRNPIAVLVAAPLAGAAAASLLELWRARTYARGAVGRLLLRHRRRYGAYLAHLGIVLVAAGVAGSQLGHSERDVVLRPGQQANVAGHVVRLESIQVTRLDHGHVQAVASVAVDGSPMQPGRIAYPDFGGQSDALVAIRTSVFQDLYVVLGTVAPDGSAAFLVAVNPLVDWIWAGAALLVLGVLFGNLRAPVRARLPAPATRPSTAAVPT
ncbi:MAG TPA: cytochrome c-type biogenesis CcmF C-terminal domain-containing protein [Candidatus Dormibacteraeota bacterium]